jgi:hypothetical protein
MWIRVLFTLFITLFLPVFVVAQECVSYITDEGATFGQAEFIGEPWDYTWAIDEEWDNNRGEYIAIAPITYSLPVPGEAIRIRFEDGTEFVYGADLSYHAKGDNLSTLHTYGYGGESGPYEAIRTADGEIFLLDGERCEPVSWNLILQ